MLARPITPERYTTYTRAALWSLTVIVVSGGAVRLTGSGLGCSDWPNCEEEQFVADLEFHALVEFVNRLFTGVVAIAVVLAVLGSRRRVPRRHDLERWSWGLVAGVVAQIILGALLVKTELDPRFTMGHFLLSMVLLWNAVVLHHRAAGGAATGPRDGIVGRLALAMFVVGAGLLVTGTVVTGSGPHSGSDDPEVAARLPFIVRDVTRVHSITAIVLLVIVIGLAAESRTDELRVHRGASKVAALLVLQGAVGYAQYFNGVPVLLVGIHITLASITWISIVRVNLEVRASRVAAELEPAR